MNRLVSAFKDKQHKQPSAPPAAQPQPQQQQQQQQQASSTAHVPRGDDKAGQTPGGPVKGGKTQPDDIPSISPRRRLEEYLRSMEEALCLLRAAVGSLDSDQKLPKEEGALGVVEVKDKHMAGNVPLGELIAELRGEWDDNVGYMTPKQK